MADLRKRVGKGTDLDTETENEATNQDSDAVCFIFKVFFMFKVLGLS